VRDGRLVVLTKQCVEACTQKMCIKNTEIDEDFFLFSIFMMIPIASPSKNSDCDAAINVKRAVTEKVLAGK
jgi:hypothetical protein